jgi:hypothetical protein
MEDTTPASVSLWPKATEVLAAAIAVVDQPQSGLSPLESYLQGVTHQLCLQMRGHRLAFGSRRLTRSPDNRILPT